MEKSRHYKRNATGKSVEEKLNYLLDTCILIDFLRGNPNVYDLLVTDENIKLSMSTVTMMELMIGAFNKREVNFIQKAFRKIEIIYIDNEISKMIDLTTQGQEASNAETAEDILRDIRQLLQDTKKKD